MFDRINSANPHHAYAVEGGPETREELFKILEKSWGIRVKGNPDFSYRRFTSLGVDEARLIKAAANGKAFDGGKKVFVIDADSMTSEAQNSLLKIFEEPTANTHFFIIGNCVKNLLPTLNSRLERMTIGENKEPVTVGAALEFLKGSTAERLSLIKQLADDIKEEKKTKNDALTLLQDIESALYRRTSKGQGIDAKLFADLELCREYLSDRSAGVKMLLEYVALVTPKV